MLGQFLTITAIHNTDFARTPNAMTFTISIIQDDWFHSSIHVGSTARAITALFSLLHQKLHFHMFEHKAFVLKFLICFTWCIAITCNPATYLHPHSIYNKNEYEWATRQEILWFFFYFKQYFLLLSRIFLFVLNRFFFIRN
jgi:hypothetical protein